jgi:hypothetical protein
MDNPLGWINYEQGANNKTQNKKQENHLKQLDDEVHVLDEMGKLDVGSFRYLETKATTDLINVLSERVNLLEQQLKDVTDNATTALQSIELALHKSGLTDKNATSVHPINTHLVVSHKNDIQSYKDRDTVSSTTIEHVLTESTDATLKEGDLTNELAAHHGAAQIELHNPEMDYRTGIAGSDMTGKFLGNLFSRAVLGKNDYSEYTQRYGMRLKLTVNNGIVESPAVNNYIMSPQIYPVSTVTGSTTTVATINSAVDADTANYVYSGFQEVVQAVIGSGKHDFIGICDPIWSVNDTRLFSQYAYWNDEFHSALYLLGGMIKKVQSDLYLTKNVTIPKVYVLAVMSGIDGMSVDSVKNIQFGSMEDNPHNYDTERLITLAKRANKILEYLLGTPSTRHTALQIWDLVDLCYLPRDEGVLTEASDLTSVEVDVIKRSNSEARSAIDHLRWWLLGESFSGYMPGLLTESENLYLDNTNYYYGHADTVVNGVVQDDIGYLPSTKPTCASDVVPVATRKVLSSWVTQSDSNSTFSVAGISLQPLITTFIITTSSSTSGSSFIVGDVVVGSTSGATATVVTSADPSSIQVISINGTFAADEIITTQPAHATGNFLYSFSGHNVPLSNKEGIIVEVFIAGESGMARSSEWDLCPAEYIPRTIVCLRGTAFASLSDWKENLDFVSVKKREKGINQRRQYDLWVAGVNHWLYSVVGDITTIRYGYTNTDGRDITGILNDLPDYKTTGIGYHSNTRSVLGIMRAFPMASGHSRGGGGSIAVVNHWIRNAFKNSGYTVDQQQLLKQVRWFRSVYSMTLNPASFGSILVDESLGTRHEPGEVIENTSLFDNTQRGDVVNGGIFVSGHGSINTFIGYEPYSHTLRPAILQHIVHRTSGDLVSHFIHTSNANIITGAGTKCDSNLFVIDLPERVPIDIRDKVDNASLDKIKNILFKIQDEVTKTSIAKRLVDTSLFALKELNSHIMHQFQPFVMFDDNGTILHSENSSDAKFTNPVYTSTDLGYTTPVTNPLALYTDLRHDGGRYWLSEYTDAVIRDLAISTARQAYWGLYLVMPKWITAIRSTRVVNGLMGYISQLYEAGKAGFLQLAPHRLSSLMSTYDAMVATVKQIKDAPSVAFNTVNDWYVENKDAMKTMFAEAKLSMNNGLTRVLGNMGVRLHNSETEALLSLSSDEVGGTLQRFGEYEIRMNVNLGSFELTVDNFTFAAPFDAGETYSAFVQRSSDSLITIEPVTQEEIYNINGVLNDYLSEETSLEDVASELRLVYEDSMLTSNVLSSINSHHSARLSSMSQIVEDDMREALRFRVDLSNTVAGRSINMLAKISRNPTAGALVGMGVAYAMGETDPTKILMDTEMGVAGATLVDAALTCAKTVMDIRVIKAISRAGNMAEESVIMLTRGTYVKSLISVAGGPAVMAGILAGTKAGDKSGKAYDAIMKAFGIDRKVMDETKVSTLLYDTGKADAEIGGSMLGFEIAYGIIQRATASAISSYMGTSVKTIASEASEASTMLIDSAALIEDAELSAEATSFSLGLSEEMGVMAGGLVEAEGEALVASEALPGSTIVVLGLIAVVNTALIYNYLTTPAPDGNSLHFSAQSEVNALKGHNLISEHTDASQTLGPDGLKKLGEYYENKIHAFRDSDIIGMLH